MKRRILKTFTAILLMIVAIAGFMPCINREVKAETETRQIVFDQNTIESISLVNDSSFSKDGITLTSSYNPDADFDDGGYSTVILESGSIYIRSGSFTFSSSVGQISKIEITCSQNDGHFPAGWIWNENDHVLTWQGDPSDTVSIEDYSYREYLYTSINGISEMVFTVITEHVVTEYPLYVGKNQVTSAYLKNETEGWEYDPDSNTLYLNNANITDTNTYIVTRDCISYHGSPSDVLTISLSGNSTVGDENAQYAIEANFARLVITGNGSLTVNGSSYAICAVPSLTIKDVSITANTGHICSFEDMVIDNSTVTVLSGTLESDDGYVEITDSRVEVAGKSEGIISVGDYISISGDSYVKADVTGSQTKDEKIAMWFADSLELKDGVEIVEPEEAEIRAYKIPGLSSDTYTVFEKGSSSPAQKVIIAKTYTIKFVNDDGTELQSSKVITGVMPKYEGDTPTKPSDGKYEYTFKGWDKEIKEAKEDATYTAVFESKEISTPQPDPKPVTPFPVPNTGIEAPGSDASLRYIALLGICAFAASFFNKKH